MAENFFGLTDRGKVRDNNEDTFIVEKILQPNMVAACVIDGVGGYEGGEIAARIAKETIQEYLLPAKNDLIAVMKQAFITANQKIYEENRQKQQSEPMACVCTLAVADIKNNQFHYAHVGDTRLYLLRDNTLVKLTKDHSFVGFLEDNGRLTEEEAMRHPKRNEINKALGFDPQIELQADYIDSGSSPFLPGDVLLLCSDGLTDMVTAGAITELLTAKKTLRDKCRALIAAANEAGGADNITVVLVHNNKTPLKLKATRPADTAKNEAPEDIETTPAGSTTVIDNRYQQQRGRGPAIAILLVLCIIFLAGFLWQWFENNKKPAARQQTQKERNAPEKKLQDSIDKISGHVLSLSDAVYGSVIVLNDTVFIRRDSLHINGNGAVLRADSAYKGPGLLVTNARYVLLENLVLENFETGVLAQGKDIYFVNVQFRNCNSQVQYQSLLKGNRNISGGILDSIIQTDSLFK